MINCFAYLATSSWLPVPAIRGYGLEHRLPGHVRRAGDHVVVPDQGRPAAAAERRSLIAGGWLGCIAGV